MKITHLFQDTEKVTDSFNLVLNEMKHYLYPHNEQKVGTCQIWF